LTAEKIAKKKDFTFMKCKKFQVKVLVKEAIAIALKASAKNRKNNAHCENR
jgi:hypothetical protein